MSCRCAGFDPQRLQGCQLADKQQLAWRWRKLDPGKAQLPQAAHGSKHSRVEPSDASQVEHTQAAELRQGSHGVCLSGPEMRIPAQRQPQLCQRARQAAKAAGACVKQQQPLQPRQGAEARDHHLAAEVLLQLQAGPALP